MSAPAQRGKRTTAPLRPTGTVPQVWTIKHQSAGAVDSILLGDTLDDEYRIGVTVTGMGDDDPDVHACLVYPCRDCGWSNSCGDCHS